MWMGATSIDLSLLEARAACLARARPSSLGERRAPHRPGTRADRLGDAQA